MNTNSRTLETNKGKASNPSWNQVQQALQHMDGETIHEVSLEISGKGSLLVGGGNNGRYLVVNFAENPVDEASFTLSDLGLTGPDVTLTVQTFSEYPARLAVKLPLVLKVFEHFYYTGQVPKDVRWEIDSTGEEAKL
jgi:hypothetical protein